MGRIKYLIICCGLIVFSCSDDSDSNEKTLATYLNTKVFEKDAVIACAASDKETGAILTFYYPELGASNVRYYETKSIADDKNEYSNYEQILLTNEPFFNGYLGKFSQAGTNEKWIIVSFELDGEIKLSNPIKSKQLSKPTQWNSAVAINQLQSGMPKFEWEHNPHGGNAIYFQVISNIDNNLLAATYTYDSFFQYYKTSNVVLNVTREQPPLLKIGDDYNFTLMDVSEDNWVNWVVLKSFIAE